jgi:hypothetical protein
MGIYCGAGFVALADLREFFDSIALAPLHEAMATLPLPREACALARRLLDGHALSPGRGLAQGSALSPTLSNLALVPLDRALTAPGRALVRYCDNLCMPAATEREARAALDAMRRETRHLGLTLKEAATQVVAVSQGFLWLGFWIGEGGLSVSDGAVAALRARLADAARGHRGDDLRARLEPILRGWAQYFDAPIPPGASLGEHDRLARAFLALPKAPEPSAVPAVVDDAHGCPWWEEAVPAPDAVAAHLDEADRLAAAGDFTGAEVAYAAAEREAAMAEIPVAPAASASWDDEAIDGFLGLFAAGQECFEVAPDRDRARFAVVARPPSSKEARDHIDGTCALAVRPLLGDGTTTLGVLDVDARTPDAEVAAAAHAGALASVARAWGIAGLLEATGGRGYLEQNISAAARQPAGARPSDAPAVEEDDAFDRKLVPIRIAAE